MPDAEREEALRAATDATDEQLRQKVLRQFQVATDDDIRIKIKSQIELRSNVPQFLHHRDNVISFRSGSLRKAADRLTELWLIRDLVENSLPTVMAARNRVAAKYAAQDPVDVYTGIEGEDADEELLIDLWLLEQPDARRVDALGAIVNFFADEDGDGEIDIPLSEQPAALETQFRGLLYLSLRNANETRDFVFQGLIQPLDVSPAPGQSFLTLWQDAVSGLSQSDLDDALQAALTATEETVEGESDTTADSIELRLREWLGQVDALPDYLADRDAINSADIPNAERRLIDLWTNYGRNSSLGDQAALDEAVAESTTEAQFINKAIESLGDDHVYLSSLIEIEASVVPSYKLPTSPDYDSVRTQLRNQIEEEVRDDLFARVSEKLSDSPVGDTIELRPATTPSPVPADNGQFDIEALFAKLSFKLISIQHIRLDASAANDVITIDDLSATTLESMEINLGGKFISDGTSNRADADPNTITVSAQSDEVTDVVTLRGADSPGESGADRFIVTSSDQSVFGPVNPNETSWTVTQFGGVEFKIRQGSFDSDTGAPLDHLLIETFSGDDIVDAQGVVEPMFEFRIESGPGQDRLTGTPFAETIDSGPGDDTVTGGPGIDQFIDEQGTDILREFRDADVELIESRNDDFELESLSFRVSLAPERIGLDPAVPDRRVPFDELESLRDQGASTDSLADDVPIFESIELFGGDYNNRFVLQGWTGGGILDGRNSGDFYDITVTPAGSGTSFLNLDDTGTAGIDELVYRGDDRDNTIQLDTVCLATESPECVTANASELNRWQGYGDMVTDWSLFTLPTPRPISNRPTWITTTSCWKSMSGHLRPRHVFKQSTIRQSN